MSIRSLTAFALGCALGFAIAFVALRSDRAGAPTIAVAPSDAQVGPRVTEILSGKDPLRRVTGPGALVAHLGPAAVPPLVEAFEAAPLGGGDPELVLLGMWWAGFDPQAALEWTTTEWRAQFAIVIAAVIRSWAHDDPKRALDAARALVFPGQREIAMEAAIAGWDESGQPGLLEAVTRLDDAEQQRVAEMVARRRVFTLGPVEAFHWAESLEATPEFREMMTGRGASAAAGSAEGGPIAAAWATPRVRSDDRISSYPRR